MDYTFLEAIRRHATALLCPRCKAALRYCKGDNGQDYLYCPDCLVVAYDPEQGAMLVIGAFT